jgi:syntaxin 18
LTDFDKEQVDAHTKGLLRDLNASIMRLSDAEQVRQSTEAFITRKKYARLGLGALGSWAAGGAAQSKTIEHEQEEARQNAINQHRESVLWYLRQKLQECGSQQASMMEKRILREVEKSKSVLAKSRPKSVSTLGGFNYNSEFGSDSNPTAAHMQSQSTQPEQELTPEQLQMFEKQNTDLLKLYENKMDQMKYVCYHVTRSVLTCSQNC